MQPVNFHTHSYVAHSCIPVFNFITGKDTTMPDMPYFTAGIHPWYLSNLEKQKETLELMLQNKKCIAIGECGIDKVCVNDLDLQYEIFEFQCLLARKTKKPMIIHAVKSHFDCAQILKNHGIKKAVFHGFNGRYTILEKILEEGFMVSFGEHITHINSPAAALIKSVPLNRFFLETDDSENGIYSIYHAAATLLKLSFDQVVAVQNDNFNTFIA